MMRRTLLCLMLGLTAFTLSACRNDAAVTTTPLAAADVALPTQPPVLPDVNSDLVPVAETAYMETLSPVWLAGDTHVHDDHSADGSAIRQAYQGKGPGNVSVKDQINMAQVSGLYWLPLTDHRTYFQHYDPLWTSSSLLLIPGEEANGSPHATALGAVESIVQNARESDLTARNPRIQQSLWDAHGQNASYGPAHPDEGEINTDGTLTENAHAVGHDRVEIWNRGSNVEREITYCETRWNSGFRFGVVGGSDDHFKELWGITPPGSPKTWVMASDRSERGILSALQKGHSFVAIGNPGPELYFTLAPSGRVSTTYMAGDEVIMPATQTLNFVIDVNNAVGMTLNIVQAPGKNSPAVYSTLITQNSQHLSIPLAWRGEITWFRAELRRAGPPAGIDTNAIKSIDPASVIADMVSQPNQLQAITSPIFVSQRPVEPVSSDGLKLLPDEIRTDDNAVQMAMNTGRYAGFPDVVRMAQGGYLVWEDHGQAGTRILGRRLAADLKTGAAVVLSGTSKTARFPRMAARGSLIWLVWQDERAGQMPRRPAIYARYSRDAGRTWSKEMLVRVNATGRAERPVVVLPKGSELPMIAWQELNNGAVTLDQNVIPPSDATGFDVWAAEAQGSLAGDISFKPVNLSLPGKTYKQPTAADTRAAQYFASVWPSLAVDEQSGEIVLAYQDNRNDPDPLWTGATGSGDSHDNDIFQIRVHSWRQGKWSDATTLGALTEEGRHPAVAFGSDGPMLAWVSRNVDQAAHVNLQVLATSRSCTDKNGQPAWCAKPAVLGGTGQLGSGQYVRLGNDGAGNLTAVWYDSRSSDWRWKLAHAEWRSGNWSDATLVQAPGNNLWPAIANGWVSFVSTRRATRLQRDYTHEIYLLPLGGR